jgi:hypothetical protein
MTTTDKCYPYPRVIVEIWINSKSYKGINLTTRHTQARGHHEWQQFTTWPKSWAGSYLTIVPSFTRMPQRTHRGWIEHYPIVHPWSEVRYRPTCRHTKLLSLGIPYVLYAPVHNSNLLTGARRSVRNRLRRGLPPWSSEYQIKPLSFLPIKYSPRKLICIRSHLSKGKNEKFHGQSTWTGVPTRVLVLDSYPQILEKFSWILGATDN